MIDEPRLLPWAGDCCGRRLPRRRTTANAALAAEMLSREGVEAAVIDPRFVKPLDEALILQWARRCGRVLTVEENVLAGGFGSAVLELLAGSGLVIPVHRLGIGDLFVEQGPRAHILSLYGLDAPGICREALAFAGGSGRAPKAEGAR